MGDLVFAFSITAEGPFAAFGTDVLEHWSDGLRRSAIVMPKENYYSPPHAKDQRGFADVSRARG
jgi:hypothetical protein